MKRKGPVALRPCGLQTCHSPSRQVLATSTAETNGKRQCHLLPPSPAQPSLHPAGAHTHPRHPTKTSLVKGAQPPHQEITGPVSSPSFSLEIPPWGSSSPSWRLISINGDLCFFLKFLFWLFSLPLDEEVLLKVVHFLSWPGHSHAFKY